MSDKQSKDVPLRVRPRGAGVPGIPPTCTPMDTGGFELASDFWSDLFEDDEDVERFVVLHTNVL